MIDRNATYTINYDQAEQLRNVLEATDTYFDSLLRHLPKLIQSYEQQYYSDEDSDSRHLRRLYLLGTLGENCREQIRLMLVLLRMIRA